MQGQAEGIPPACTLPCTRQEFRSGAPRRSAARPGWRAGRNTTLPAVRLLHIPGHTGHKCRHHWQAAATEAKPAASAGRQRRPGQVDLVSSLHSNRVLSTLYSVLTTRGTEQPPSSEHPLTTHHSPLTIRLTTHRLTVKKLWRIPEVQQFTVNVS